MHRYLLLLLAACLVAGQAFFVSAAAVPSSGWTTTAFGDWLVRCPGSQTMEGGCQLLPDLEKAAISPAQFGLVISRQDKTQSRFAVMTVPEGVYLASGVELSIDGGRPYKILYEVCRQGSCHAGFKLTGAVVSAFKRGAKATARVWLSQDRVVEFSLSLIGFTKAYSVFEGQASR